jgi:hypothetical protein
MGASQVTTIATGVISTGSEYIRHNNLDDESLALFKTVNTANYNIVTIDEGYYTFTYKYGELSAENKKVLHVTLDQDTAAPALLTSDVYLYGTATSAGWKFDAANKLTPLPGTSKYEIIKSFTTTGELSLVALKPGTTIASDGTVADSDKLGNYDYKYAVKDTTAFAAVSAGNQNIKFNVADEYIITFDAYSQTISIAKNVTEIDVYIKGSFQPSWAHGFASEYKFAPTAATLETADLSDDEYVLEFSLELNAEFGIDACKLGQTSGSGKWVGRANLGSLGNANSLFGTTGNLKASVAGTYRFVYHPYQGTVSGGLWNGGVLDIYTVPAI